MPRACRKGLGPQPARPGGHSHIILRDPHRASPAMAESAAPPSNAAPPAAAAPPIQALTVSVCLELVGQWWRCGRVAMLAMQG